MYIVCLLNACYILIDVIQCSDTKPCPDGYYCVTYFGEEGICLVENTKSNNKVLHTDDETNRLLESSDTGKDEPAPIGPFLPLTEKELQGLKDENSKEEEENDLEEKQENGEREEKEYENEVDEKQEETENEEQEQEEEEDDEKEKQTEKQEDDEEDDEEEEGRVEPKDDLDEPDEEIIENDKEENDQEEEELDEEEDDKEEYEEDQDDNKDLDTTDRITRNVNEDEELAIDNFEDAETNVVAENDAAQTIEDDMTIKDESEDDVVEEKTKTENEPKDDDNVYTNENEEKIGEETDQNSMANIEDNDIDESKVETRSIRGLKRVPRRGRYRYRHRFNGRRGHHRHPYRNHGRVNKIAIKKKDLPTVRRILKSFMHLTKYHYKLDVARYLNQYRRGNIKTIREVEQITKTRDAILKAEKTGFKESDKPETVVEILKKASPRNSDNFIFKFLYNYYNGQRYAKRKYRLFKARITNTKASTKGCCSPPSTKQKTEPGKKANSQKHFFRKHHGNHLRKPLVHNKMRIKSSKTDKQHTQPLVNHQLKMQHPIDISTPTPEPNMKHGIKTTYKTSTSQIMSATKEKLNTVVKEASAALDALNKAGTRQKRNMAHESLMLSFGMPQGPSQWDDLNANQQHNAFINSRIFKRELNQDNSQGVPNPSTNLRNRGDTSHEQILADFESSSSDKKQTVDSLDQPDVKSNSFQRKSHYTFEDEQDNMNQEIDDKNADYDMDLVTSEEEAKNAQENPFVEEFKMRMKRAYRRE